MGSSRRPGMSTSEACAKSVWCSAAVASSVVAAFIKSRRSIDSPKRTKLKIGAPASAARTLKRRKHGRHYMQYVLRIMRKSVSPRCEFAPKNSCCYCCSREPFATILAERSSAARAHHPAPQLFVFHRGYGAHPRRDGAHRHLRHRAAATNRQGRQRHLADLPAHASRLLTDHVKRASFFRAVRFRRLAG